MVIHSRQKEKTNFSREPGLYLVSTCLLGLRTRYDGKIKPCASCREFLRDRIWIPFCPEQLGGLPTPRAAADINDGDGFDVLNGKARVMTKSGLDVTANFIAGAYQILEIAESQPIQAILLKAKSPSCGMTPRFGVTAALLHQHGFQLKEF
ncbi:MAG: DUF523 domain-containing protein [Desulfobulbaceae bacterium]|nr:DUF523 domain-containing protein [Desulfobulbaceae bacterium]